MGNADPAGSTYRLDNADSCRLSSRRRDAVFDDVPNFVDQATQNRDGRHLVEFGDYLDLVRMITLTLSERDI